MEEDNLFEVYRIAINRLINDKNGRKTLIIPPTKSTFLRKSVHEYCESHNLNHVSAFSHRSKKPIPACEKCHSRRVVWDEWNWHWYYTDYTAQIIKITHTYKKIVITKK